MNITRAVTLAIALTFSATVTLPAAPAAAQTARHEVAKPKKKAVKRQARSGGGQIACTAFGCHPIPRNCRPQTGYRWDGMPSGFDVVVCR